ncbi:MAG: ATP-binding protein [Clostridiaceae bacterium]
MELVIISGKGGTGKTTIASSLVHLSKAKYVADCDVDAPNMYLMYEGKDIDSEMFSGEKKARIDENLCISCGKCEKVCEYNAIKNNRIIENKCEGCGACTYVCPTKAISLDSIKNAEIMVTESGNKFISRATMEIGSDGSGRLISKIREKNEKINKDNELTIIDGSPGIGCSVIASITNVDIALIVTEPTLSGLNDLKRIAKVCNHFKVKALVCINKYSINEKIAKTIEEYCSDNNIKIIGKISYDDLVMKSINELKPIVFYENSVANKEIREMWQDIKAELA